MGSFYNRSSHINSFEDIFMDALFMKKKRVMGVGGGGGATKDGPVDQQVTMCACVFLSV